MFTEYVHLNRRETAFQAGAYLFIFTGVGHLAFELVTLLTRNPIAQHTLTAAMPVVNLLGRQIAYNELTTGFSYAMGLLLISFGLSFLLNRQKGLAVHWLALTTASLLLLLSWRYFFIVPITTMALATLSFLLALLRWSARVEVMPS